MRSKWMVVIMEYVVKTRGQFLTQLGLEARTSALLKDLLDMYQHNGRFKMSFGEIAPKPRHNPETYLVTGNVMEDEPCVLRISFSAEKEGYNVVITAEGYGSLVEKVLEDFVSITGIRPLEPSSGFIDLMKCTKDTLTLSEKVLSSATTQEERLQLYKAMLSLAKY